MSRKFIARIAAVAIAVTAIGHTPAKADDDLATALATVVGVAIIGGIINNQLRTDNDIDRATRNIYDRTYFSNNRASQPRFNTTRRVQSQFDNRRVQPRPLPRRVKRAFLPGECLQRFGDRRVLGERCLDRRYGFKNSLPKRCEIRFRANGKKNKGYNARCLRREGYRIALR